MTRILIITDAWLPQINGVVRSIEALVREAPTLGVEIEVLAANEFHTVPLPTYPQVRVALTGPGEVRRRIEKLKPDFIHIATEGPLGLCAWFACRRAGRSFTTCYHTRFPEYLAARRVAPSRFVYALLRRFHNAGSGMMVSTETLGRELDTRGFGRLMRWSHGVDCDLFRPRAASIFEFPRPIFLTCARVAIEKNLDAFLSLDLPGSKVVVGDGPARRKLQTRFPGAHFVGELRSSTDFHSRTIAPINPRSLHEARANDRESQQRDQRTRANPSLSVSRFRHAPVAFRAGRATRSGSPIKDPFRRCVRLE